MLDFRVSTASLLIKNKSCVFADDVILTDPNKLKWGSLVIKKFNFKLLTSRSPKVKLVIFFFLKK